MPIKSGKLWALIGASRSGKTQKAIAELKRFKCVLIWDVEGQYHADHRASTLPGLLLLCRQLAGKPGRIAYTGQLTDFDGFCKIAFWWVRACCKAGKQSALVCEETSDVTNPAKAPPHYGILLRRGLKYGVDIFAITQRPAESDKTAVGNASVVHICRMQTDRDRKYVEGMTGVPFAELKALRADQDAGKFDFITVDTGRGFYRAGVLTFPGGKPKFTTSKTQKPL